MAKRKTHCPVKKHFKKKSTAKKFAESRRAKGHKARVVKSHKGASKYGVTAC